MVFFDTDMQTSTRQEVNIGAVCMHSGVIEGGWVCGHGSAWLTCIPV